MTTPPARPICIDADRGTIARWHEFVKHWPWPYCYTLSASVSDEKGNTLFDWCEYLKDPPTQEEREVWMAKAGEALREALAKQSAVFLVEHDGWTSLGYAPEIE